MVVVVRVLNLLYGSSGQFFRLITHLKCVALLGMTTDVRSIQIAGARPKDLIRRRRSRRRQDGGGDDDAPISSASGVIAISKLNPEPAADIKLPNPAPATSQSYQIISNVGNNPFAMQKGGSSASTKSNIPPPPELKEPSQAGGVILKSKSKTAKVLLKKKDGAAVAAPAPQPSGKTKRHATRKVVLKSLVKRMKKTRHAVKNAQSIPLERVRAALIEKKLIKPTSKAPESVLRQIYSDSLIVAKKTL